MSTNSAASRAAPVSLPECRNGTDCTDITEEHNASYFHPGVSMPRQPCPDTWCKNFSIQHRREFAHHRNGAGCVPLSMINTRDPVQTETYGDFAVGMEWHMDAEANARRLIAEADAYLGPVDMDSPNIREICEWFKRCRPMHMCSSKAFLSILNLGEITSSRELRFLWLNKHKIVESIIKSPRFEKLGITDPYLIKTVKKYLKLYIKEVQTEMMPALIKEAMEYDRKNNTGRMSFEGESNLTEIFMSTEVLNVVKKESLVEKGLYLSITLGNEGKTVLEDMAKKMLLDIKDVLFNLPGCQCSGDINPRLNYSVPVVVGPHYHNYGNTEVVLVLRPEIMFHPDYYDTPFSALMYSLGLAGNKNWGRWRPNVRHMLNRTLWHANEGDWEHGGSEDFFKSKMHRTAPSYYEAFVKEWLCRMKNLYGIEPANATLASFREVWNGYNAHYVTEGHLPINTPIDYIEAVIIQKHAYDQAVLNELGKAFLAKYEAAGRLYVVNSETEVNEKTGWYIDNIPLDPIDYPTGFCFVLNNRYDNFMPFSLSTTSDVVHFSFKAHGAPFFLAVNNIGDFRGSETMPRKAITFRINSDDLSASFNVVPTSCILKEPYQSISNFNAGCPVDTFVHYAVTIDYNAGLATLRHWGPSSIHNKSVLQVQLEKGVRYSYISFSALSGMSGNIVIWDVSEDKDPRPMMQIV